MKEALGNSARAVGAGDALGLPRAGETQQQADDRNALTSARDLLCERLKQPGALATANEASNRLDFRPRARDSQSNVLPALNPKQRGSETTDPVETFVNGLQKSAAAAKAEADAFGKSNAEKQTAIALAKAQEIASQNGTTLTEAQTAAIRKAATETQDYRDRLADLEQGQRQAAEAARYFAQTASDGLADAIINGKSFSSVLADISKQLERSLLTGLLTGTGPLAGVLRTAPLASAGSNANGSLFGGFGGSSAGSPLPGAQGPSLPSGGLSVLGDLFGGIFRANGGPVSAGMPVTVGEMGRELFVPQADGQIMPIGRGSGGSQSVDNSRTYSIDARGAQVGVAQQITAALQQYDRGLDRSLSKRVGRSQARYGSGP